MNAFDIVKDIVSTKGGHLSNEPDFSDAVKSIYLLQRWVSMFSLQCSYLLSQTTNKLYNGFDSSEELYKLLVTIMPKQEFYKFKYIKRDYKSNNDINDQIYKYLSFKRELSISEIKKMVEFFNIDLTQYNKELNIKG